MPHNDSSGKDGGGRRSGVDAKTEYGMNVPLMSSLRFYLEKRCMKVSVICSLCQIFFQEKKKLLLKRSLKNLTKSLKACMFYIIS